MNREQFIRNCKSLMKAAGIKPQEMVVAAGGSLLLRGLRSNTEDIDVSVTEKTYAHIKRVLPEWIQMEDTNHPSGCIVLSVGPFDIHNDSATANQDYEIIDGVACQTLEDILELKQRLNRPKDQLDIKNIRQYIRGKNL